MEKTNMNMVAMASLGKVPGEYSPKRRGLADKAPFQAYLQKSASTRPGHESQSVKQALGGEKEEAQSPKKLDGESKQGDKKTDQANVLEKEADQTSSKLEKKLSHLADTIKEKMQLSEEEMQTWLSSLGMQRLDLLDLEKLQEFFLQVKGVDLSQVLTQTGQAEDLKTLMVTVKDLKTTLSLEEEAQIKNMDFDQGVAHTQWAKPKTDLGLDAGEELTSWPDRQPESGQKNLLEGDQVQKPKIDGQVIKQEAIPFFDKVVQTQEQVMVTAHGLERVSKPVSVQDIYDQVVTKFTSENLKGNAKLTLQLNPDHLGKLAFQVVSRQGQVSGQFVAESERVKTALEAQVSQLKLHLANQGIQVAEVKVVVGDTANYFNQEDRPKDQGAGGKKKGKRTEKEIVVNPPQDRPDLVAMDGRIDFTA